MKEILSLATKLELERWYPLIEHPVQTALVEDAYRFKVVPAGRRSGKTEHAKRYVAREAMQKEGEVYFLAAPTRDQVKKIFWRDIKQLTFSSLHARRPSESDLVIFMPSGSEIHLIGLDRPERMEGQYWSGGVIDEIANVKEEAWNENISPALDTYNPNRPDYRAWAWLIGVPEGLNHYFDLWQYAESGIDEEWKGYTWFSSDILPKDVIDSAKRRLSSRQYRQEYEASFETAVGKIYEDYGKHNFTKETLKPHEQIRWTHDFNYTPLSSAVMVERGSDLYVVDEIILRSAVAQNTAKEFVDRFKDHENKSLLLYGDPSGRIGEKHGQKSNYLEIEAYLREYGWTVKRRVRAKAPAIRDRQNAVRAKLMSAAGKTSLFVNVEKCPYSHKGLATTELKEGSAFQEEEDDYQHITTAIGYMITHDYPVHTRGTKISEV